MSLNARLPLVIFALVVGLYATAAQSQASQAKIDRALTSKQREELGKTEYDATCSLCHGLTGRGDGIYVDQLKQGTVVANLTQLSKKNGGTFPFERVYQINGREYVKAHGPRQMSIWGLEYKIRSSRLFQPSILRNSCASEYFL